MSTYGSATRHLFEASVTIERSFEDGYGVSVKEQVNEPTLKIRVGRVQLDITKRLKSYKPSVTKIDKWNYYAWLGRYFVDLYVEDHGLVEERPYYFYGSGDWTEYHGRMVDKNYRGE